MRIFFITKNQLIGCPRWGELCAEFEQEECGMHCFTKPREKDENNERIKKLHALLMEKRENDTNNNQYQ